VRFFIMASGIIRSEALDHKTMVELTGGERRLRYAVVVNGPTSVTVTSQFLGLTFHDGYLSRHTLDTYKRRTIQTEYSYWDNFIRM
jgi:hypothetical protein